MFVPSLRFSFGNYTIMAQAAEMQNAIVAKRSIRERKIEKFLIKRWAVAELGNGMIPNRMPSLRKGAQ